MATETFISGGTAYEITVNGVPTGGKKYPIVMFVHGNFGLGVPYGDQIRGFAKHLNGLARERRRTVGVWVCPRGRLDRF
jgi:hypothetical protein